MPQFLQKKIMMNNDNNKNNLINISSSIANELHHIDTLYFGYEYSALIVFFIAYAAYEIAVAAIEIAPIADTIVPIIDTVAQPNTVSIDAFESFKTVNTQVVDSAITANLYGNFYKGVEISKDLYCGIIPLNEISSYGHEHILSCKQGQGAMAYANCQHSFKEIQSPNSILSWNCGACHSGPHWWIWECIYCKIKRCRPCLSKS